MKAYLIVAAVTGFALVAPIGSAYAQAPENRPSTQMDKGGHMGVDNKAIAAGSTHRMHRRHRVTRRMRHGM